MEFCEQCSNMYYIRLKSDEEDQLIYYCRNCGFEKNNIEQKNICVSKSQLKKKTQKFNHIINRYTKLDPTIPRDYKTNCPNSDCITHTDENKKEVLYMRYDDDNMKFLYMCNTCDHIWKNE